jgi:hypothetical protein
LVYEIKLACWWLKNNGYEIHMLWIPSHVGVHSKKSRVDSTRTCGTRILPRCVSNQHVIFYCVRRKRADQLAGDAVKNGMEWHALVRPSDFSLSRVRLLEGWQSGWDGSDMGRYAYSFWSVVSFMP